MRFGVANFTAKLKQSGNPAFDTSAIPFTFLIFVVHPLKTSV